MSRGVVSALAAGLAVLAFCTVLLATPWGVGLSGDSPVYIGVARSLLAGHGVIYLNDVGGYSPVSHYPPLYSIAIAGLALGGSDPLEAARYLNAVLFAANVVLATAMAFAATRSRGAALAAAFLMFAAFPMAQIHSMAWSEPLFTALGFSGLLLLANYLQRAKQWMLWTSAIIVGLSCLTRYAGAALVCTGALGILAARGHDRRIRARDAAVFFALSSLVPALWVARNLWLAGSAANRGLGFHPPGLDGLITAVNSLSVWFLPAGILTMPLWIRVVAVGLFALVLIGFAAARASSDNGFVRLLALFLLGYGGFVLAARCFFDPKIPFDTRILSPAYPAAMIVTVAGAAGWIKTDGGTRPAAARWLLSFSVVAILIMQSAAALAWWKQSHRSGIGFAESSWSRSEVLKIIDSVPRPADVFTNVPDLIYMWTGKRTAMIPRKLDPDSRAPNPRYAIEMADMKRALENAGGIVAYYHAPERLWYLPSAEELQREAGLRVVALDEHALVYRAD